MKKFKFRLESVLKYKNFLEKEAKQALMSVNLDIKECQLKIEEMENKRLALVDELEKRVDEGITIEFYHMHRNYIASFENSIAREQKRLEYLFKEKDLKTKRLIDARKEKEAMERLKDKTKEKFMEEMLFEEQKELDEISSIKKAREICNDM